MRVAPVFCISRLSEWRTTMINLFLSDTAAGSAAYDRKKLEIEYDKILSLSLSLHAGYLINKILHLSAFYDIL